MKTFIRVVQLASSIRGWMALAALLSCCTIVSGVGLMATSGFMISQAALYPTVAALGVSIVGVRFFGIARGVFRYLERIVSHRATFRLLSSLRVWFYSALEPLLPARVLDYSKQQALRTGDLLRRAVADIDMLQNFYLRIIAPPVVAMVIALGMCIFLGYFGLQFALTYSAFFLTASVAVPLLTHLLSQRIGRTIVETRADLHAHLVDSIQGNADLIAFGQEQKQAGQIDQLSLKLQGLQMIMAQISGIQGTLISLLTLMSMWTILLVAIPYISGGELNGVFLAMLALSALASFEIVQPIPGAFQQLGGSLKAANRLTDIVDTPSPIRNTNKPSPIPDNYNIQASHLSFRYAEQEPLVLDDINFSVPQGRCIAIVGSSGAGKSTIAHLLLRYWDYQKGHLTLGGHELDCYHPEDLYQYISVLEQDTYLFNTSIKDNLLLARSDSTLEEAIEAAKQAQLHDFIMSLPNGYDTPVGEQGLRLSGGERQRIAIARAILKNAPILLLDEPTVNLDAITERAIMQTLRQLCKSHTTLLITHRLIEMDMADEILVLQNGRVIERGTHIELLQKEGQYWQMWQRQQSLATAIKR